MEYAGIQIWPDEGASRRNISSSAPGLQVCAVRAPCRFKLRPKPGTSTQYCSGSSSGSRNWIRPAVAGLGAAVSAAICGLDAAGSAPAPAGVAAGVPGGATAYWHAASRSATANEAIFGAGLRGRCTVWGSRPFDTVEPPLRAALLKVAPIGRPAVDCRIIHTECFRQNKSDRLLPVRLSTLPMR